MNFKHTINKALKGQKHQHRATPCDWRTKPLQALKGRHKAMCRITPFDFRRAQPFRFSVQGSNLRVFTLHRATPDANAKRLSAFTVTSCLFTVGIN